MSCKEDGDGPEGQAAQEPHLLWSAFNAATVVGGAADGVECSEIKAYGVGADGM